MYQSSSDCSMIEYWGPLSTLGFAFISSDIKRGSPQASCCDTKIHNLLFNDPQTMWKGYLNVTQSTEIVTSSLEGEIDIKPIFACHYSG